MTIFVKNFESGRTLKVELTSLGYADGDFEKGYSAGEEMLLTFQEFNVNGGATKTNSDHCLDVIDKELLPKFAADGYQDVFPHSIITSVQKSTDTTIKRVVRHPNNSQSQTTQKAITILKENGFEESRAAKLTQGKITQLDVIEEMLSAATKDGKTIGASDIPTILAQLEQKIPTLKRRIPKNER